MAETDTETETLKTGLETSLETSITERHFTAYSSSWWSWQAALNCINTSTELLADSNILVPELVKNFEASLCHFSLYFFSRTLRELTHSLPNKTFISTTKNARTACFLLSLKVLFL